MWLADGILRPRAAHCDCDFLGLCGPAREVLRRCLRDRSGVCSNWRCLEGQCPRKRNWAGRTHDALQTDEVDLREDVWSNAAGRRCDGLVLGTSEVGAQQLTAREDGQGERNTSDGGSIKPTLHLHRPRGYCVCRCSSCVNMQQAFGRQRIVHRLFSR